MGLVLGVLAQAPGFGRESGLDPELHRRLYIERLAAEAAIPRVYYAQAAALYDACAAPKAAQGDSLVLALREATNRIDSTHLYNAALNLRVSTLRTEALKRFRKGHAPSPALNDPGLFRKLRVLSDLDEGSFLEDARTAGLPDSTLTALRKLRASLQVRTARYRKDFEFQASQKEKPSNASKQSLPTLQILFLKLDPDFPDHLMLASRLQFIAALEAVWTELEFTDFLARREIANLMERIAEDSIRSRIVAPKHPILMHKLKGMLQDAVWVDPSRAPLNLSGYLFSGGYRLSIADSALIQGSLDRFGRKYAHLAHRIDPQKPETWDTPAFHELETLSSREAARIRKSLSKSFDDYLDYQPSVEVELDIRGDDSPDYFSDFQLFLGFQTILGSLRTQGDGPRAASMASLFPDLPPNLVQACAADTENGKGVQCQKEWKNARSTALRNSLRLTLGPILSGRYKGSSERLKKVVALNATI